MIRSAVRALIWYTHLENIQLNSRESQDSSERYSGKRKIFQATLDWYIYLVIIDVEFYLDIISMMYVLVFTWLRVIHRSSARDTSCFLNTLRFSVVIADPSNSVDDRVFKTTKSIVRHVESDNRRPRFRRIFFYYQIVKYVYNILI